nr:hypothetical protein [Tanacetum cinerariifolium]
MSVTVPPIPPPFRTSSSNMSTPNVNRVDTMPTTTDHINTATTTNVSQSVVDDNLPQLLDSKGGSHVTNVHAFHKEDYTSWKVRFLDNDSDVEEDQRTSNEFMADLNAEYHERALLANQKRIDDLTKGNSKNGKNEKGKSEKDLIAESFDWDEETLSLEDEGTTKIKALMEITEDEPSVGKADARSGQWVDITMKKVHRLLSMTDGDERKHVLDYTHVDLYYVKDQRKNLLNKFNLLKQELSLHKYELYNLKNIVSINHSLQNEVIRINLENESMKDEISDLKKALGERGKRKEKISSKEVVFTKSDESSSMPFPKIISDSESECETHEPVSPLPKLIGAAPADKKADSSTKQLLFTLMEEVKGLKRQIEIPSGCEVCGSVGHEPADCLKKHPNSGKPRILTSDPLNPLKSGFTKETNMCEIIYAGVPKEKKSDAVDCIMSFIRKMEKINEVKVKELRSDNETEFKNHKKEEFCDKKVATTFIVFNIKRQEMEETVRVTFNEDDEAISQSSSEGDAIDFNENRSFPDDEFLEPRSKDPVSYEKPPEFTVADDHPTLIKLDHPESADNLKPAEIQDNVIMEPISDVQPTPILSPSVEGIDVEVVKTSQEALQSPRQSS